jgi:hypothetical protein
MKAPSLVSLDVFSVGPAELGKEKARLGQRLSVVVSMLAR